MASDDKMHPILQAMVDLDMTTSRGAHNFASAFAQIEAAEDAIQDVAEAHPDKVDLLNSAFMLCRSPIIDKDLPFSLFGTHCRQLLNNIADGIDLDRPTMVEVSIMMVRTADRVPIRQDLSLMVLSDADTMEAYGMEAVPAPETIGDHLWPELRTACRRFYTQAYGKPRSELARKVLNDALLT